MADRNTINSLKKLIKKQIAEVKSEKPKSMHQMAVEIAKTASNSLTALEALKNKAQMPSQKADSAIQIHIDAIERILHDCVASPLSYLDSTPDDIVSKRHADLADREAKLVDHNLQPTEVHEAWGSMDRNGNETWHDDIDDDDMYSFEKEYNVCDKCGKYPCECTLKLCSRCNNSPCVCGRRTPDGGWETPAQQMAAARVTRETKEKKSNDGQNPNMLSNPTHCDTCGDTYDKKIQPECPTCTKVDMKEWTNKLRSLKNGRTKK